MNRRSIRSAVAQKFLALGRRKFEEESEKRKRRVRRRQVFPIALVAVGFLFLGTGGALAVDCPGFVFPGAQLVGGECQVTGAVTATGSFTIPETLHILSTGSITTSNPLGITLEITSGNFIMESGAVVSGDSPGGCDGGNRGAPITITVDNGSLFPAFAVDLKTGSYIHSNSCSGGDIVITALNPTGGAINVDGTVESVGSISGTGAVQAPGGGTITIKAFCNLTVSDTGLVSSRGGDPGADLVHLEACVVEVDGKVESTGAGHAIPNSPTNHCYYQKAGFPSPPQVPVNPADDPANPRTDKPANSTACVEIWAGTTLTINSVLPHNGQVNADTGSGGGNEGTSWIDLFARGNINIIGDSRTFFAVHANDNDGSGGTGSQGGLVDVLSTGGKITASGNALQANGNPASGGADGGTVNMDADQDLDLTGGTVEAKGATSGTGPNGGTINGRSWHGAILADAASLLDVTGGVPVNGTVNLKACGAIAFPPGVITGASTINIQPVFSCVGDPAPPSYVTLPAADCASRCGAQPPPGSKSGRKFNSFDGTGLNDWVIHLFGTETTGANIHKTQSTHTALAVDVHCTLGAVGCYDFENLNPGTYHVCEQLKPGWTQASPASGFDCSGSADPAGDNPSPGPFGYTFTIVDIPGGDNHTGNDFGNHTFCEKLPVQTVLAGRVPDVIVRTDLGGSIQAAVTGASDTDGDGYIIVGVVSNGTGALGGSTTQNVVIDQVYPKPFLLIGCSVTLINPTTNAGNPTGWIKPGAGASIFVMDLHGTRSTGVNGAGWKVEGNGRELRNTYGSGNTTGIWFVGNNNIMHNGSASSNSGVGLKIEGNGNYVTDTDAFANTSHGVLVTGGSNQLLKINTGDKGKGNGGDGLSLSGTGNWIQEVDAYANKGNGISASGASNTLYKNVGGDKGKGNGKIGFLVDGSSSLLQNSAIGNLAEGFKLTTSGFSLQTNVSGGSGSGIPNAVCQYRFTVAGNTNSGGNKSNGVVLTGATFPIVCKN